MASGQYDACQFSSDSSDIMIPPGMSLAEIERRAVEMALEHHHGNRTRAAASLGISVRTLQRKLKAWGLAKPGGPEDNAGVEHAVAEETHSVAR